ncbi:unnamed protein product [Acanthoscelides obtectus]|uniref:Uncharacterized protein n=1 Tax=Acanthoscelides obtectus TaxID=200917 RepID=A0A9P0K0R7_ACAOB|nr:unnamed protein product [Acanthoscelides obtectus]CAK1631620.1 hypothetical protein AOBTE_LOCUS7053 [Acanthoscelides obtectus]
MPPPPSPPHPAVSAVSNIDNVSSRQGSLERVASGQRKRRESIEQTVVKEQQQQHPEEGDFTFHTAKKYCNRKTFRK